MFVKGDKVFAEGIQIWKEPATKDTRTSNITVVSLIARVAQEKSKFHSLLARHFCYLANLGK